MFTSTWLSAASWIEITFFRSPKIIILKKNYSSSSLSSPWRYKDSEVINQISDCTTLSGYYALHPRPRWAKDKVPLLEHNCSLLKNKRNIVMMKVIDALRSPWINFIWRSFADIHHIFWRFLFNSYITCAYETLSFLGTSHEIQILLKLPTSALIPNLLLHSYVCKL